MEPLYSKFQDPRILEPYSPDRLYRSSGVSQVDGSLSESTSKFGETPFLAAFWIPLEPSSAK